ncbi:MAG: HipA domain-containing protein [Acidimicrobiia bacterium]|nr:HipA domain-containing protein [Acidimicrobiia bacterium]
MSRDPLVVTLDGIPVAEISDAGSGLCALRYLDDVVGAQVGQPLISVRLPVRNEVWPAMQGTQAYLDGVLPEGWMRDQLAKNARLPAGDTFGLLARYGGDCAGAVAFHDRDSEPAPPGVRWLDPAELTAALADLRTLPLGDGTDDTIRLSLGGVQEKLVVVRDSGEGESGEHDTVRYGTPTGTTPSTHILKPSALNSDGSERFPGIAEVEHLCVRLAAVIASDRISGVGFTAATTSLETIGGRKVLVVERYDRRGTNRLHQEDGCQILGRPPSEKYQDESNNRVRLAAIAQALETYGADPLLDQRALLQQVAYTVCVGNADLHARNLSVVHDDGVRLAPMYDVVATASWTDVSTEFGLRIGEQYDIRDVRVGDLVSEAVTWGLGERAARRAVDVVGDAVTDNVEMVRDEILEAGFGSDQLLRAVDVIIERTGRVLEN